MTIKLVITPKTNMPILLTETEFQEFRGQLHKLFKHRADSTMDLLDALCSNNHTPSVVQLSLNPLFRRGHSALFKAIGESLSPETSDELELADNPLPEGEEFRILNLIAQVVPMPKEQPFFLLGMDCTSRERAFAQTLKDRGMVHQSTTIKGNKPIAIGHSYSMLGILPERSDRDAPWTIPLDMSRVPTESNSTQIGLSQLDTVLNNPNLPWSNQLCVLVADSAYGNKQFLTPLQEHKNLVVVARVRSNRVFYQSPVPDESPARKGHPIWYGERFDLKEPETWPQPSEVTPMSYQTRRGKTINLTITSWSNMLMLGSKDRPTHNAPFTLLRIESFDESGLAIFRPMWLIVIGTRRGEISSLQAYQSYRQRFDLEHFFRFEKQNLLLTAFQTPVVQHEQQWVYLVMLAYVQLWAAHFLAVALPRPWEQHSYNIDPSPRITPSKVQQDWNRIISQLGSPAVPPQPRGKSSGRNLGQSQTPRPRHPVVKKGKSPNLPPQVAA